MAKLRDDEVLAICQAEIAGSLGFLNGKLAQGRLKALQYYNAEPYGNEIDGSSQIVTTEVRDTVESIMPSLMKIFMSGDKVAQFDPTGPEDEAVAEQATDYANYIFTKDNPGFLILETAFRDALIQKVGIVKLYWDDAEDLTRETYQGLSEDELQQLVSPDEIEVIAHTAYAGTLLQPDPATGAALPAPATLHDVVVRRRKKTGRVRIVNVPPEEFLISRRTVGLADAGFIGHRVKHTASELIQMGYDTKLVDDLPGHDADDFNQERIERFRAEDEAPYTNKSALDPAAREIWVTECYIRMDFDGDGITELRKITVAGDPAAKLLDNEAIDSLPFCYWTPVPQPHKFHGLSIADLTMDLQLTQSTVLRQLLDNMYRVNNGRFAISDGVNVEDMMTVRPGGLVRMTKPGVSPEGQIMPLVTPSLGSYAYPLIEFLDSRQETRTGVTRYNQGLDANSLNQTASGINVITGYAQLRQELIARNAAEMLVAGIFKSILELICKHQQEPRLVQLRNRWVPMSPREWNDQMNVTVTVGIGTGNKDQQLAHLMSVLQIQQQAIAYQGGADGPLVTLGNVYNTVRRICENAGLKTADPYFTDPKAAPTGAAPAGPASDGPPPPDPLVLAAQAKAAAEQQRVAQEPEIERMKALLDQQTRLAVAEIQAAKDIEVARIGQGLDLSQTVQQAVASALAAAMGNGAVGYGSGGNESGANGNAGNEMGAGDA
ncbi:MAG: hypothetical protein QOK29_2977 [Rhodospirillaceae bacterium]|jgi:hypothetical protein|nr:hypothetical protein [Rhodospirillaceae bacterium]